MRWVEDDISHFFFEYVHVVFFFFLCFYNLYKLNTFNNAHARPHMLLPLNISCFFIFHFYRLHGWWTLDIFLLWSGLKGFNWGSGLQRFNLGTGLQGFNWDSGLQGFNRGSGLQGFSWGWAYRGSTGGRAYGGSTGGYFYSSISEKILLSMLISVSS